MFPHPDTICQFAMLRHEDAQAELARARRAAEARPTSGQRALAAMRGRLGVALLILGTRLEGSSTATPAVGATVAHPVR